MAEFPPSGETGKLERGTKHEGRSSVGMTRHLRIRPHPHRKFPLPNAFMPHKNPHLRPPRRDAHPCSPLSLTLSGLPDAALPPCHHVTHPATTTVDGGTAPPQPAPAVARTPT
ncbi:hypothetical protein C8J57DRAFT_1495021 [Mycena rebaudengoi]|nr:hypothetical protein C8J57DRAFT_1495021 [Mycena rebaudengoi]